MDSLPVATTALRQQELAVGREIAPPIEIAGLEHAATLALAKARVELLSARLGEDGVKHYEE